MLACFLLACSSSSPPPARWLAWEQWCVRPRRRDDARKRGLGGDGGPRTGTGGADATRRVARTGPDHAQDMPPAGAVPSRARAWVRARGFFCRRRCVPTPPFARFHRGSPCRRALFVRRRAVPVTAARCRKPADLASFLPQAELQLRAQGRCHLFFIPRNNRRRKKGHVKLHSEAYTMTD